MKWTAAAAGWLDGWLKRLMVMMMVIMSLVRKDRDRKRKRRTMRTMRMKINLDQPYPAVWARLYRLKTNLLAFLVFALRRHITNCSSPPEGRG